jgi:hypothetical protein
MDPDLGGPKIKGFYESGSATLQKSMNTVSPAYGYIESALVQCSNDGGPGPRHNMKGDHGSSIFNRQVVYHLNPLTSSENQGVEGLVRTPSPPSTKLGRAPLPPPWGTYPAPCKQTKERPASEKSHFSL